MEFIPNQEFLFLILLSLDLMEPNKIPKKLMNTLMILKHPKVLENLLLLLELEFPFSIALILELKMMMKKTKLKIKRNLMMKKTKLKIKRNLMMKKDWLLHLLIVKLNN